MEKQVKYGLFATISSGVLNLLLALTKIFVAIASNSVSILFDAVNNFGDIISSVLGSVGIGLGKKEPTKEYPCGFGRIDYIMTFVISTITLIMGGLFIFYSVERLLYPMPVFFGWAYFAMLVISMVVKLLMGVGFFILHKKDGTDISKAMYIDCFMDTVITGSTVVCYALCLVTNTTIDAIFGIVIGVMVLISAVKLVKNAVKNLLGYNVDIDIDEIEEELVQKQIFTSIKWLKINDYGKQNREMLISGDVKEENYNLIKDIEKRENIKIYVVKE